MALNTLDDRIEEWNRAFSRVRNQRIFSGRLGRCNGPIWSSFEHMPMEYFEKILLEARNLDLAGDMAFPFAENLEKKYRKAYSETAENSFRLSNFFVGFINSQNPDSITDDEVFDEMWHMSSKEIDEFKRSYCKLSWASEDIFRICVKNCKCNGEHQSC